MTPERDLISGELENTGAASFKASGVTLHKHEHWCKPCGKKILKWGCVVYVAHWVLHGLAFLLSPAFGLWLLALI
jgi:hypothetical protein